MRRLLAITVIAALVCSTGMPVWASACEAMRNTPMCHRTPDHHSGKAAHAQHHCDMMTEEGENVASQSTSLVKAKAVQCPMQCCTQANAGTGFAVPAVALAFSILSLQDRVDVPAVAFSSPGFSSHTDRGPPAA